MIKIADLEFEPFIDAESIQKRINLLALQISRDYAGRTPIFLGILNGSVLFLADLMKQVSIPCEMTFTKLASYYGGLSSSRHVREDVELYTNITGRDVVIVEDIVDTGNTLNYLIGKIKTHGPASVTVCSLLLKPGALEASIEELKYIGFEIDNEFVVGYGLDYKELGRNVNGIYRLVSS
ncbi:hypoxanthine phosphoribosyltransferase [Mucilaginibacter koreensis]